MNTEFDIAVIGGGPVGMFTAYFASLHGLKTILLESLAELGGQPKHLYPAKTIRDIPLFDKISGDDLTKNLKKTLNFANLTIKTGFYVEEITESNQNYVINNKIASKTIVVATGAGAFEPKKSPIEIAENLTDNFHYFVQNPEFFANKSVAILGGGDSALDNAEMLAEYGAKTTLIHRRDKFRGQEGTIKRLGSMPNVNFLTPYLPTEFNHANEQVEIILKSVANKEISKANFDEVVVAYGIKSNNDFVKNWGIATERGLIKVNREFETSRENIYAVGDAINYQERVPVIALGFGEAQIVITQIVRKIFPDKTLTIHSTNL